MEFKINLPKEVNPHVKFEVYHRGKGLCDVTQLGKAWNNVLIEPVPAEPDLCAAVEIKGAMPPQMRVAFTPDEMKYDGSNVFSIPMPDNDAATLRRFQRAKQAIIELGYFKPDEVGDDLAPRIIEYHSKVVEIFRAIYTNCYYPANKSITEENKSVHWPDVIREFCKIGLDYRSLGDIEERKSIEIIHPALLAIMSSDAQSIPVPRDKSEVLRHIGILYSVLSGLEK